MPIGIFLSAIIKLVIEYLFINKTAEEINKSWGAVIGLFLLFYQLNNYFPELKILEGKNEIILIFTSILFIGIMISLISTFFASKKYLNLKTEKIY